MLGQGCWGCRVGRRFCFPLLIGAAASDADGGGGPSLTGCHTARGRGRVGRIAILQLPLQRRHSRFG